MFNDQFHVYIYIFFNSGRGHKALGWVETGSCQDETGLDTLSRLTKKRDETPARGDAGRDEIETI